MNISIIIPANLSAPLHYCLLSLSMQKYQSFEVVVVCNSDNSEEFKKISNELKLYMGKSSLYNIAKVNNRSAARNVGIRESSGEILLFLDQDMLLNPMFMSDLYLTIQQEFDKEFIIYSKRSHLEPGWGFKVFSGEEEDENVKSFLEQWSNDFDTWESGTVINDEKWADILTNNLCVLKSFIERNDLYFDENYQGWGLEDIDWGYRAKESHGCFIMRGSNCWHISHPFSIGKRRQEYRLNARYHILKSPMEWLNRGSYLEKCHARFRMEVDGLSSKMVSDFDDVDMV